MPAARGIHLTLLCASCALCCDGSLFGRAPLGGDERDRAKRHLRVVASGASFEQPCAALAPDRSCAIYAERPRACRAFECRLLARGGPLEPRVAIVARVRALLARVHDLDPLERAELEDTLAADFARA